MNGSLVIVLGDQLSLDSSAFDDFDAARDTVWMAEVAEESEHVWSTKMRIAVFLSAMRHFAQALREAGKPLIYRRIDDPGNLGTLAAELTAAVNQVRPSRLVLCAPGDWRVLQALRAVAEQVELPLDLRPDGHFYGTVREFAAHARRQGSLRMEFFYREMRVRHGVLMEGSQPAGGRWNFDAENRRSFGKSGPRDSPAPPAFTPDPMTREVLTLVDARFAAHPGTSTDFAWPVTRADALRALQDFVEHRLADFGRYQDALWPGEPWLYHSQLSCALNLKLLDPREVVDAAVAAWQGGRAPLSSVEGFVRQILGWREYVRGVYWTRMPAYLENNELDAHEPLPAWYWTGHCEMACLKDAITQTLRHGYAHHIQRLMVTGLYAMLLGVEPKAVHAWYLAVYVDAVEWVEMPNTLGMSQYADGGLMASKPYVASGRYIERMGGGLCAGCRYDPGTSVGDDACPFTTLYWDFLMQHEAMMAANPRTRMQVQHLQRFGDDERAAIRERARQVRGGHLANDADGIASEPAR